MNSSNHQDATVFVVDDDPASRESLCVLLESKGLSQQAFASASEFLQQLDPSRNGCVITDYRMPGINGIQLQTQLAQRQCPLPVIMVSGYADVPVAVRAMELGAVTVLQKPLDNAQLLAALDRALAMDRQRSHWHWQRKQIATRIAQLSDLELQIVRLLIAGRPNKAVAKELDLGLRTVERRRRQILQKMGVGSLPELAALVGSEYLGN